MLNAQSDLEIPPESHFIPKFLRQDPARLSFEGFSRFICDHPRFQLWDLDFASLWAGAPLPDDAATGLRKLYASYPALRGKNRYGDKTPEYAMKIAGLARMFPEAVFVHLVRDGRDAALSLLDVPFGPTRIEQAATYWTDRVIPARRDGQALPSGRYIEIRYEDLLADPAASLRQICDLAGLTFEPMMADHQQNAAATVTTTSAPKIHSTLFSSLEKTRDWRTQMSAADVHAFEIVAGPTLAEFGYDVAGLP